MNKVICILLSTYNGSSFIGEQIQTLLNQTYQNWRLYIRDDGSSDTTREILSKFVEQDSRIQIINDNQNIGIKNSFLKLLQRAEGDYYMFCDQDDVWDKNKLEVMVKKIEQINDNIPILVTCDLRLINAENMIIHKSMRYAHHINKLANRSWGLIIAPMFPGCSMMFNNIAKQLALKEQYDFPLHDMQLSYTVYKNGGIILPINDVLMGYRQHSNNVVGATIGSNYWKEKLINIRKIAEKNKEHFRLINNYLHINLLQYLYFKIKHIIID